MLRFWVCCKAARTLAAFATGASGSSKFNFRVDGLGWHAPEDGLGWHAPEYSKGVVNRTPSTPFEYSGTCQPTRKLEFDAPLGFVVPLPDIVEMPLNSGGCGHGR